MNEPKAGDVIRWTRDDNWRGIEVVEYTLEVYRFTLGFFESEDHRVAGRFTPICDSDLWIDGPDTEERYMPHMGLYHSNQVPAFDIIKR
ncbi:hypothetical protein [Citrobacter freundii]|uniref:hypothetical protein n=1 Tax=Citrobacter freundii TaxID=546 RepID=UPI001B36638F|nr:hypothetical protein [Citrobacter freundii]MBQ0243235.1 hypothetical protein [Citrobacter freundii]